MLGSYAKFAAMRRASSQVELFISTRSAGPHRWRYGRSVGWTLKQCTVGSGTAPAFPSVSDSRGATGMRRNAAMEGQSCSIAEFPREKRTKRF
jgi:hypothetical protein